VNLFGGEVLPQMGIKLFIDHICRILLTEVLLKKKEQKSGNVRCSAIEQSNLNLQFAL
jgi:hypothetical protein